LVTHTGRDRVVGGRRSKVQHRFQLAQGHRARLAGNLCGSRPVCPGSSSLASCLQEMPVHRRCDVIVAVQALKAEVGRSEPLYPFCCMPANSSPSTAAQRYMSRFKSLLLTGLPQPILIVGYVRLGKLSAWSTVSKLHNWASRLGFRSPVRDALCSLMQLHAEFVCFAALFVC